MTETNATHPPFIDPPGGLTVPLHHLYQRHWPNFLQYRHPQADLSAPLLIDPPDDYFTQSVKLFVVGQETKKWENHVDLTAPDAIGRLMAVYREFKQGLSYRRGAFFRFLRRLEANLNIAQGAVVWSNLNKVDQRGGRPSDEVREEIFRLFPVLPEEIKLTAPNVVVFFTSWRYDAFLQQRVFPGAEIQPEDGNNGRWLARVAHDDFLPKRSFRTYHPAYLQRARIFDKVMVRLVELCAA